MEATSTAQNKRGAGKRHAIIAILRDGDSVDQARQDLEARDWTDVVAKRVGEVLDVESFPPGDPVRLAVDDARELGFACVVYADPIKPT